MVWLPNNLFSPDLSDVLTLVASLDDTQFEVLQTSLLSDEAFDLDRDRCERIAARIGSDTTTVQLIVSFLAHLYGQANSQTGSSATRESVGRLLSDIIELDDEVTRERLIGRVTELIAKRDSADRFRKTQRLQNGFLPNAVSFAAFVDARPVFSADRSFVESFVRMVQLRINTDSDDSAMRSVVLQIAPSVIGKLRDHLDDVERRLATLSRLETSLKDDNK